MPAGTRYHGMSPLVSQSVVEGLADPMAIDPDRVLRATMLFARTEGLIVAPETSHAVAAAVREARKAKEEGKEKTIVFGLSGHGLMDLKGYQAYMAGELAVHELEQEVIEGNLAQLKGFPEAEERYSGRWR